MKALSGTQTPPGESDYQRQPGRCPFVLMQLIALESAFAPTLFPRMRGSRLLRHGTALYCRNTTV
jgi:hypothetical protein